MLLKTGSLQSRVFPWAPNGRFSLGCAVSSSFTFGSIQQSDLKAVPAGFLRVAEHRQLRAGSQEGRLHLLCIPPVNASAFTAKSNISINSVLWRLSLREIFNWSNILKAENQIKEASVCWFQCCGNPHQCSMSTFKPASSWAFSPLVFFSSVEVLSSSFLASTLRFVPRRPKYSCLKGHL